MLTAGQAVTRKMFCWNFSGWLESFRLAKPLHSPSLPSFMLWSQQLCFSASALVLTHQAGRLGLPDPLRLLENSPMLPVPRPGTTRSGAAVGIRGKRGREEGWRDGGKLPASPDCLRCPPSCCLHPSAGAGGVRDPKKRTLQATACASAS